MRTESELIRALKALQQRYADEAKPLIDELVAIRVKQPAPPMMLADGRLMQHVDWCTTCLEIPPDVDW
jgi:hypothetical protein